MLAQVGVSGQSAECYQCEWLDLARPLPAAAPLFKYIDSRWAANLALDGAVGASLVLYVCGRGG